MKQPGTIRCCLNAAIVWWGAVMTAQAATTTDFSRYQVILDRKPFGEVAPIVLPGAAGDGQAVGESFAKDYEMKAIIDDGDKIQLGILDKKANKHIYLNIGQEIGGMQLVSVNYDEEEAMLKRGGETAVIKLHPDKNAAPAVAGAPGLPTFVMPGKNLAAESAATPFGLIDQSGSSRKPFFSDIKRRGTSPFQRLTTNTAFQSRSLESFFKPNTNMTMPFVSPFRPQPSPFKPVSATGAAGQENPNPFTPIQAPDQGGGAAAVGQPVAQPAAMSPQMQTSPSQGDQQIPMQPVMMPYTETIVVDESDESEE
ncbi:MAG: hypothetical protein PHW60_02725 [Kiritimatiellae bacterium]|nr:hypothetical protein [Kiritimatiellia bacterium]